MIVILNNILKIEWRLIINIAKVEECKIIMGLQQLWPFPFSFFFLVKTEGSIFNPVEPKIRCNLVVYFDRTHSSTCNPNIFGQGCSLSMVLSQ